MRLCEPGARGAVSGGLSLNAPRCLLVSVLTSSSVSRLLLSSSVLRLLLSHVPTLSHDVFNEQVNDN